MKPNMYLMCPQCGSRLILRKGPYGEFYGCSKFPLCKYTIKEKDAYILEYEQERELDEISEKNPKVRKIIQKIEDLDDIGKLQDEKEKKELKNLDRALKNILEQARRKREEEELEYLARKPENKISKFLLNQTPKLSWFDLLFHQKDVEFIKWRFKEIRKAEQIFNQKIEIQFSYGEIIHLLRDNIKGEIKRAFKIVKFSHRIKQFMEKELAEANNILEQVVNNCEINQARYKFGKINYERGLDDLREGYWQKTNWRWKKALHFLNKISLHYKEYCNCKYWFIPVSFDGSYFFEYYGSDECENVPEEINKIFNEMRELKNDREVMIKSIDIGENNIRNAKKEAKRIRDELDKMLKELEKSDLKKGRIEEIRKVNEKEYNFSKYVVEKEEEIEKNQYFRLVQLSQMYDLLGLIDIENLENAASKYGIKHKHKDEYIPSALYESWFLNYGEELKRIAEKIKGREGPVQFVEFPPIFLPEDNWSNDIGYLKELIEKMKLSAKVFIHERPDLEKRLQNLKRKIEDVRIEWGENVSENRFSEETKGFIENNKKSSKVEDKKRGLIVSRQRW